MAPPGCAVVQLHSNYLRIVALAMPVVAVACSTNRYAGIDLRPSAAPIDVQQLAREASSGDKQAQLELGRRYEEADGLPRNARRATRLYRIAAKSSGGVQWIYQPAVGGSKARVVPVSVGPFVPGSEEAARRLDRLAKTEKKR